MKSSQDEIRARRRKVKALQKMGLGVKAISTALGVDSETVANDLKVIQRENILRELSRLKKLMMRKRRRRTFL